MPHSVKIATSQLADNLTTVGTAAVMGEQHTLSAGAVRPIIIIAVIIRLNVTHLLHNVRNSAQHTHTCSLTTTVPICSSVCGMHKIQTHM